MPVTRKFEIKNKLGMHARAATVFVQTTNRYSSEILVRKGRLEVNGKSIMGVLQLAAAKGQFVEVVADGQDAEDALDALGALIEERFGEDE